MVIWINGAYGSGKTSVAKELQTLMDGSYIYNPENAGDFIRDNLPDSMWKDDFQDYPLWRELNVQMLRCLAGDEQRTIIVPMTVIKPFSYQELIVRLTEIPIDVRHFILNVDQETLLQRLLGRGEEADSWCVKQMEPCIAAFEKDIAGIKLDAVHQNAYAVALEIMAQCGDRKC